MRVLFDTTILVWSVLSGLHRTGIPRCAVELIKQFKADGHGADVTYGVWDDDLVVNEAVHQINRQWPGLIDSFVNGYSSRFPLEGIYEKKRDFCRRHKIGGQVIDGLFLTARRIVERLNVKPLRPDTCWDVYHSPHVVLSPHRRLRHIPRVLTVQDVLPITHPHFFKKQMILDFKKMINRYEPKRDVLLCPSETTREAVLSNLPVPPERCKYVPNGISAELHPADDRLILTERLKKWGLEPERYILSVGTLEPRKNLLHLSKCFLELRQMRAVEGWPLVLVGTEGWGNASEQIRRLAAESGGSIVMAGQVSDEELCAFYSGAGIFVFVPLAEGFGLPPLEAMKCGAPVIASNCSSLPEVVGDAAVLVDPTDSAALSEAIKRMVRDEPLRLEFRHRGFERAKQFSWLKTAELTREVYRYAIENNGR